MSLKDVPVRARLWAPDRSLPRFGETSSFFRFSLTSFALHLWATDRFGNVAQACRAALSGDGSAQKCRPSVRPGLPRLSRERDSAFCSRKGAPRATKRCGSVAQACRATLSGDGNARKCRPSVGPDTLGRRKVPKALPRNVARHPWATVGATKSSTKKSDCQFADSPTFFVYLSFETVPWGGARLGEGS